MCTIPAYIQYCIYVSICPYVLFVYRFIYTHTVYVCIYLYAYVYIYIYEYIYTACTLY